MTKSFNTIALFGRFQDPRVSDSMSTLATHLAGRGVEVLMEPGAPGSGVRGVRTAELSALPRHAGLVVAVGGDGTMLYAARLIADRPVPLLGINRGRLGFLADIGPEKMLDALDDVLAGNYEREERLRLEARLDDTHHVALNDIVLQRWDVGRMLEFETLVNGVYVNTHRGDGLIIATPTGSTAYALSCSGPILAPALDAIAVVPICPHTLSDRPIVIPSDLRLQARVTGRPDTKAQVTCDGHLMGDLHPGMTLEVAASAHRLTLLHPLGHDYFKILRSKLNWGRGRSRPQPAE